MTEPKVVRYNGIEQDDEGAYVYYDVVRLGSDYEALAARVEELEKERVKILGEGDTLHYKNVRLWERVRELEKQCRETNEFLTDRNNDLLTERQENTRLREALERIAEISAKE